MRAPSTGSRVASHSRPERHGGLVVGVAGVLLVVCALGASRLTVENSFVDYFSEDTEIYRGLALIDRELGGTTPLEVILDLDEDRIFDDEPAPKPAEHDAEAEREKAGYWFTEFKIERIKEVHDWLASQPEVGKVLSLASLVRVGETLNDGEPLDSLQLALVYRRIPEDMKRSLIDPYIDILWDEARISLRIRDTEPDLHRKELLDRIRTGLARRAGARPGRRHRERTARALQQHAPEPVHVADLDPRGGARRRRADAPAALSLAHPRGARHRAEPARGRERCWGPWACWGSRSTS